MRDLCVCTDDAYDTACFSECPTARARTNQCHHLTDDRDDSPDTDMARTKLDGVSSNIVEAAGNVATIKPLMEPLETGDGDKAPL